MQLFEEFEKHFVGSDIDEEFVKSNLLKMADFRGWYKNIEQQRKSLIRYIVFKASQEVGGSKEKIAGNLSSFVKS